jgi:NAD+ synthase (glutamine-hydrolysing)
MLNPSASHFAIDKHQQRYQIIKQGSKVFDCIYVYSNLIGCEAGRTIYDGGNMVAANGELLLQGKCFSFQDVKLETTNVVIELTPRRFSHEQIVRVIARKIKGFAEIESLSQTNSVIYQSEKSLCMVLFALALGLWDWQHKTYQKGYVVSLSGGADSALCACAVYLAHVLALAELGAKHYQTKLLKLGIEFDISKPEFIKTQVMPQVLTTVYQASENSGEITMNAASQLAAGIGASHHQWQITNEVASYKNKVETALGRQLTWQQDDIALQNIQARVRSPGIWFVANIEHKLLIATSNLSEASVGYCTMDGDTSGVLAPIGGISKSLVLKLNDFLCNDGISIANQKFKISQLQAVIKQQPTAELRPVEQNDEADLMPFEVLDKIRYLSQVKNLDPQAVFIAMQQIKFKVDYTKLQLQLFVKKYYQLYSRNQWKRERLAVSFHIEYDSACPKTFRRFPVLNNMSVKLLGNSQ